MANKTMKTLTIGENIYEIYDESARTDIATLQMETSQLSETVNDLKENGTGTTVTGGSVKTILENMMTIIKAQVEIDSKGATIPQVYNSDVSAIVSQTDTLIANLGTAEDDSETEQPENGVVQTGSILAITSGVTATQTGSVLAIA